MTNMKQTDFQRLKQICEKEGFELIKEVASYNDKFFVVTKPKDIWEGVEFVIPNHNSTASKLPYKVVGIKNQFVQVYCPYSGIGRISQLQKSELNPSTEQAYIEQLKAEAFKRFGEIKEGDIFDRGLIGYPEDAINFMPDGGYEKGFDYLKKTDTLYFDNLLIYQSGKWATKIPKRIEVTVSGYGLTDYKTHNCFEVEFFIYDSEGFDQTIAAAFLASKLEEYLNEKK